MGSRPQNAISETSLGAPPRTWRGHDPLPHHHERTHGLIPSHEHTLGNLTPLHAERWLSPMMTHDEDAHMIGQNAEQEVIGKPFQVGSAYVSFNDAEAAR